MTRFLIHRLILPAAIAAPVALTPASAWAQAEDLPAAARPDGVTVALDRGVQALLELQQEDGSFVRGSRHRVAISALGAMALLACGHLPDDPTPEGDAVRRAVDFVLDDQHQTPEGYFGQSDNSRMYGHGIVTLLLSELAGMTGDEQRDALVRERLVLAIDLILRSQAVEKQPIFQGGWRYQPQDRDADLSITVWQVMALRSAQSAGVTVPAEAIDQAVAYLERSFKATETDEAGEPQAGQFGYRPNASRSQFTFSTTAAGLLAMQVCGRYDAPHVRAASAWLEQNPPTGRERWFYYGIYYYAQGMNQRDGDIADRSVADARRVLLPLQRDDGSWRGSGAENDTAYATSMSLLSLSVENHYLPIYQR